ncbi:SPFH domain-containing protein [Stakelama sp. CBK3Z-3]|uniref:SPFH domain-containing protein n=1 Tax=Stakelama flava TaxID=2860338 RepID=A0ABS6XQV2_9SPHN|nr:SPFH domain-containing protein [Stakelama flava]MBW4332173.1 SPFH domain-containing protein [Stakelama flava]
MVDSIARPNALRTSAEKKAATANGYAMLLLGVVCIALVIVGVTLVTRLDWLGALLILIGAGGAVFIALGFYLLQPNQAAAILLFGDYRGTDRSTGLRWVWPWMTRKTVSVRVYNTTSERLKVNDLRGNPIEIASNVVWRVSDTAQALFDVDDYKQFVNIQIESAVRVIGSRYPYDDFQHEEKTLRNDAGHVSDELRDELQDRVAVAGIYIDECRLTHLAYAQEIAQAMLRRQQAEAVIAARQALVEGAVTMVETALEQLSAKNVVELDDERRAAMVSNLMVVLCSERDTQPVVNTGTLYQ